MDLYQHMTGRSKREVTLKAHIVKMVEIYERRDRFKKLLYKSIVTEDGEMFRLLSSAHAAVEELYNSDQRLVCIQTYQDHVGVNMAIDILPIDSSLLNN